MDIVDTFNYLIPTEHLDDALFLENEVCEDFSTSQNVLEDSLKNMLSDKDPMLGSASAQFCLPVLESTDPNFQMPCSTVGLDDIMDEGVKETAHSTIDEDDLSSNRKLRDQMDVTTVKSPRKSPRLMTQEPVRSLRQSTLAKRSNASPSLTAKKSAVKSGSAQKGGVKQQDKEQAKHESGNLEEHPEEMEHNSNRSCHKESVPSPLPDSVKSCKDSDELKTDTKREIPSQTKLEDTSHEVENVSHLPGTTSPTKEIESKTDVLVKRKHHSVGEGVAVCASAETNTIQDSKTDEEDKHGTAVNPFISELSSQEQTDYKTEKEPCEIKMGDKCKRTRMTNENAGGIQEMFAVQSGYEDGKSKCSSDFQASGNVAHETGLPEEDRQESFEDAGKVYFKDNLPLVRRKLDQTFSKVVGGNSAKSETRNILEHSTAEDIPPQVKHEETDNIKMKEHETLELQGDGSSNISSKGTKNVKTKHTKSKQNKTTSIQQKSVSLHQNLPSKRPVLPHVHSQSVVSLKRHAEEQEKHQHKPAKVKKKHVKKEEKAQNFDSGATLKKKAHVLGKNFRRVQVPGQGQKISAERIVDKFSHHTGSKETSHLASGPVHPRQGQLLHLDQKLLQKHQLSKADNCIKEEGGKKDSIGTPVDPLKEDEKEKLKLRKLEKNLQPRQRRSSKSISVDEPPLFIPDNISTVKKESPDHLYATESKGPWVPSKQCGFCRKPHGNRFMVGCGRCDDWFHGDCVGLSLFQAQQMGEEDKEYVCVKCCAEEDQKADSVDENMPNAPVKLETTKDSRTMEYEKAGISKQSSILPQKAKHGEDSVKHKVKIFKRESSDGRPVTESREPEMRKGQQMPIKKIGQAVTLPRLSSEEKHEKTTKDSLNVACSSESVTKTGVQEKQEAKKKRTEKGRTASNTHTPVSSATKPSVDQIRQSVRQSLKEILEKRLTDSTLKIPEERAAKVATKIEKELFSFFRDTDSKYKNKYRSLIFNLKDPKNKILFKRVLKGEVTPDHLIRMSPEELASKELAAWRKRENRHTIEMIEKEQREVERRPITKITHKGEIEIESEAPVKEQEVAMEIQEPPPVKIVEKIEETEKEQEIDGSAAPNTTSQHKNHLFDLNCKICIGRMAPPSNDLSGKNVKIAVGVARKPSDNEAENIADALSSATSMLTPELLEEDKDLPSATLTSSSSSRSETPGTVESETLFLARLNFIWKGFINMPSVAKFVIKAYPISGSFESLTEDLPDSIQVGGRISPQTVWEYVDKIKATGTKEICVIRFTPVTEEDQISYALLFAYFSSRKRYGVAANNMKQIKDLYIIPLGASDKIPHQLVPFDGPGIEVHRPNLLLGLIIRQKLKRQISAVITHAEENAEGLTPEKKSKSSKSEILHSEIVEKEEEEEEEEEDFFNSFTAVLHKQRLKPQVPNTEEATSSEPIVESVKHEPLKPLRFLPGVLVGWENQSTALELVSKPLPVDDILQSLLDTTGQMSEHIQPTGDQLATKDLPLSDKQAALKEEKVDVPLIITEAEETKGKNENSNESTDIISTSDTSMADVSCSSGSLTSLSLKGKPPDVSTEAFLANLASLSQNKETKETVQSGLKLGDADRVSLETKRTTDFPVTTGVGKGIGSNAMASVDNVAISSKSPPFINLKRDPRQAAVRGQQNSGSENDSDSLRNEEIQNSQELDILGTEPTKIDSKILSGNDLAADQSSSQAASTMDSACSSQLEGTNQLHEEGLMQSIEKVHSVRGGLLPPPLSSSSSQIETENSCHSDFGTETTSPLASGNFSPIRTPQPNFPLTKMTPPGFQFQGAVPPNFPPQNHPMFGFPPHLPPPLLPPPGYGFTPNALMPWPPVLHMSGQPPHFMGPIPPAPPLAHKLPRLTGPEHFYQDRDTRRPERRHSDPWSRSVPHADRAFSRRKSDQHRQRFYNESHSLRKGRHDWEPDSERNRHRDRSQDKDRERKNRDDGHREKERSRLSYSDKDSESKSSKEGRNPEKKEVPKSEERAHEREKEREKSKERHRERESEKSRERHHKDRDHSDRGKSKR